MSVVSISFNSRRESIEFFRSMGMTGTVKALEEAEAREQQQKLYELLCLYSAWFENNYHLYINDRCVWRLDQLIEVLSD